MKRSIISLTFIVLLFCFSALLIGIIPALNENQTLYFSSTLAQVTATLFGLTVSAYVFLDGKLTKDVNSDDSLIDVIKDLQSNYKHILSLGGIITGIALLFCIINITIGDFSHLHSDALQFPCILCFMLNCSFIFSLASIVCTLIFTFNAIDPQKVEKASKRAIKRNNLTKPVHEQSDKNYLEEFMITYNQLENSIHSFLIQKQVYQNQGEHFVFYKSIYHLKNLGVISEALCRSLQEIRKYRNYLVHGNDMTVSHGTYDLLESLYKKVKHNLQQHS